MTRLSPAITLLAMVAGGCARGPVHKPGDEYLAGIHVEGNHALKDSTITTGLALKRTQKRGRAPDPYLVDVDADRIKGEYVRRGYLDVDVKARVEREGDAATVIYTIDEGVRAKTKISITGITEPALVEKIRETLPLRDGDPFDYEKYDEAKEKLEAVVENAGYAHVKFTPQIIADRSTNTAIVSLAYEPGPKSTFGPIEITGVEGVLREAVEARLAFQTGQQYSTSAIAQTQRALYGLNRFSSVVVKPEKEGGDPVVGMTVAVSQSAKHEIKLGGGFGLDPAAYEVRARAGYTITDWPVPLSTTSIDLRPAYALLRDGSGFEPRVRALARLERKDLFWTYSTGDIEGGYDYLTYEAYTSYGPRLQLGVKTPLTTDRLQVRVGWGIQHATFRNPHPLIDEGLQMQIGIDEDERVAAYHQSLILDLRDDLIEPRLGAYAEVRMAEGTKYAGGNYDYFQIVPELRGYVPLGTTTLAARVRTGATFGDLAPTERFFAGGASSQRGFAERKLAPSAIGEYDGALRSIPYGGGALMEAGLELRVPITTIKEMPLGSVAFLDGGDVTETFDELDPTNLHWAAGLGLRLLTIIGPVRFDVAYRLNRKGGMNPEPDSSFAFHLAVGEAF
ncbi:MAG: autotransporter assembly complex family protein [Kofleriaceae bacterium]